MRPTSLVGWAVLALPAAALGGSLPEQHPRTVNGDYRIGPEDVLDVSVWDNQALSRTVPVRPDGKISLPLLDDVPAAGRTPEELRDLLTELFAEYIASPVVSVIVKEINSLKFAVLGQVKEAGEFRLRGSTSVAEALAMAGGFSDFASPGRVFVLRRNGGSLLRIAYNYKRNVLNGRTPTPLLLRPGDIVVVP